MTPFRAETEDRILQPPTNTEAEQSLLGAIFVNNTAYGRVAEFLAPEHFGTAVHGRIYAAIGTLIERGETASPVSLKNLFDQDGELATIGGAQYLARLTEAAVTVINAEHYGRTILDLHRRRALIVIGQDIVTRAYTADLDDPAERQIEAAETALNAVIEGGEGEAAIASVADAALKSIQRSEDASKHGTTAGISTGLAALDRLTGGFQRGDLIYIGGRPSQGKTACAVTLLLAAASTGLKAAFWSAEMSALRIGRRMLAALTGIPARNQATGELTSNDWQRLMAAQQQLLAYPIVIDDTASIGVGTLRRRAKQMMRRKGLDLIVIDYMQLLRTGDGRDDLPLREVVPRVSGALRDLAKELDVPVVALSQLSRDVERRDDKRPMLSDLRWGGELDQDAAVVMMLHREETYLIHAEPRAGPNDDPLKIDKLHAQWSQALADSRGRAEISVVKNRDDETGIARVSFNGARSLFEDEEQRRFL